MMPVRGLALAGLLALAASGLPAALAQSAPPAAAATVITPGDNLVVEGIPPVPASLARQVDRYTEFRSAFMFGWHPRQREMLVSTRFADTNQIHRVRQPGGARTQLTFFREPARNASYQPVHGRYMVFSMDAGGGEWHQLYRQDLDSGEVTLLTDGRSRNGGVAWDRQGTRIAYTSTRRNGKDVDVWVMDPARPETDRMLLQLEGGGWGVSSWSPDGKTLAVIQFISVNESHLWLADVATGQKRRLNPQQAEAVYHDDALFSRDGASLYLATDRDFEFRRLARLDIASGRIEYLSTAIPWNIDKYALSDDGRTMALVSNEAGVDRLHFLDTRTRALRKGPTLPVGVIHGLAWHSNNRDLGLTLNTARSPADAYALDVRTGRLTRWTTSETGGLDTSTFADAQQVEWSSFDGRRITGLLYKPPARFTGKRPVLINIHGGPEGQSRPVFLGRENYLLNELGIAILYPNVRGSTGYGKSFLKLDNGMLREDSYKDIDTLLDWIGRQGELDAQRIMVRGGSYGGHVTLAVASNYSSKICCAIDIVGMSSLVTFLENTEGYRRDLRRAEYGDERDPAMRAFLQRIAPLTRAAEIRKPLFVVQGRNDPRVPHTEALQMVSAVRQLGTPVWFLMANDEGHGFAKRRNRDFEFYATVLFMQQYLLK